MHVDTKHGIIFGSRQPWPKLRVAHKPVHHAKQVAGQHKIQNQSQTPFHLLGLMRDAAGNPADASKYYRKALYLDPEHHETLVHFAFLVEQQGDRAAAQVLRNRARRVEQNGKTR